VLTTAVVLPGGAPDVPLAEPDGPALPVVPDPVTDGGGDRLVVVTRPAPAGGPSATLLAAQQLSDEADRYPHRDRGSGASAIGRRRRRQRALVAQRRVDRGGDAAG